jgi:hypothetical protein
MGTPTAVAPNRGQLVRALRDATVALSTKTKVGTGLFVAPGLVLTCAHVVADVLESPSGSAPAAEPRRVLGEWQERPLQLELVPQWFRPGDDGGPDLALLRVRGDVPHPIACVAEAAEPGDELWAYGYPDGQYRKGDSLTFNLEGPSQRIDGAELYRAAHGRAVPGFSGSPTLNWRTGMVCGIIRLGRVWPEAGLIASAGPERSVRAGGGRKRRGRPRGTHRYRLGAACAAAARQPPARRTLARSPHRHQRDPVEASHRRALARSAGTLRSLAELLRPVRPLAPRRHLGSAAGPRADQVRRGW